jgi:hypothetical protein
MASSSSQQNQKTSSDAPQPDPALTRQEQEQATQDRTLAEFLLILDEYEPLVRRSGFQSCATQLDMYTLKRSLTRSQITICNVSA